MHFSDTVGVQPFWVISKNHDAAPTKFRIDHQQTLGSASDPPKIATVNLEFANPKSSHFEPMPYIWHSLIGKLMAAIFWGSKALPRVSWLPIQNLVGAAS